MEQTERLDATDLLILRAVQQNARLTTKELAAMAGLTTTPVYERLKRLEQAGFIRRYVAVLDAEKLGKGFSVFCNVKLKRINRDIASHFTEMVMGLPEVAECYNISGSFDYMLKIRVPDMKSYQAFLLNTLGSVDFLSSVESVFVMDEVKRDIGISI